MSRLNSINAIDVTRDHPERPPGETTHRHHSERSLTETTQNTRENTRENTIKNTRENTQRDHPVRPLTETTQRDH